MRSLVMVGSIPLEKSGKNARGDIDVGGRGKFVGVVADAAAAAHKQHGERNDLVERHGVVAGAARHPPRRGAAAFGGGGQ